MLFRMRKEMFCQLVRSTPIRLHNEIRQSHEKVKHQSLGVQLLFTDLSLSTHIG